MTSSSLSHTVEFVYSIVTVTMSVTQFDSVYHNLEGASGKLRFTQGGLGFKPSGGEGSTHTLEADRFSQFQWLK